MSIIARVPKEFIVVTQSQNTNSFGLRQHVLLARDGEGHKLCLNYLHARPVGSVLTATVVTFDTGETRTDFAQGELPQRLRTVETALAQRVWRQCQSDALAIA